jgi:carboxypeptidase C (cathepsin A)
MATMRCLGLLLSLLLSTIVLAQYPPVTENFKLASSPLDPKIKVSYRAPLAGTCESVFKTQNQYTGYITLPPFTLAPIQQNYSINTFYWFIEARQDSNTAPLTIFINGGPGSSSLIGFFQETGPCEVIQLADGSYGTQSRLWGWDRSSNMIFIDQPSQVGLSFDKTENFTHDFFHDTYGPVSASPPAGLPSFLFSRGTFSSQNVYATANTTKIAAYATWHFLQAFLSTFPQYNPGIRPDSNATSATGVNLFTESYGGIFGPVFANVFEQQNSLRLKGVIPINNTLEIKLTSLGIVNGLIDQRIQMPYYPKFANNNTYGIQAIDLTTMLNDLSDLRSPGGCDDLIATCRSVMDSADPNGYGDVPLVNDACKAAQSKCAPIQNSYLSSGRSLYDIRQQAPSPFPSNAYMEYLNSHPVQAAIGAQVNYTDSSDAVFNAFISTGDINRDDPLPALSSLLKMNVRVALLYGDADYICNWMGGEAVAAALASSIESYSTNYPATGYAEIVVNSSYVGGVVRQYGNLTFARIYDAGHQVPAYQPETAFTIFTRIIKGTSIATGEEVDQSSFKTLGPFQSLKNNKGISTPGPVCWIRAVNTTCSVQQISDILAGKGVVLNGVWFARPTDYQHPPASVIAGKPGNPLADSAPQSGNLKGSSTVPATGVYTATATPTPSSGARYRDVWSVSSALLVGSAMLLVKNL